MGIPRHQGMVRPTRHESLSMHPSHYGQHRTRNDSRNGAILAPQFHHAQAVITRLAAIAAHDLARALRQPAHFAAPFVPPSAQQTQAFKDLADIYTHMTIPPAPRVPGGATEGAAQVYLMTPAPRVPNTNPRQVNEPSHHNSASLDTIRANITEVTMPTPTFHHMPLVHQCNAVFDPDTGGRSLEYRQLIKHPL
jgi:hypothetical protein